jgi:protein subunit release factor B
VPTSIHVPEDQLDMSFVRSSGAGGQNVNKVNSQVQIRINVMEAEWIGPLEVRQRLAQQQANRINKDGIWVMSSQEHRTQYQNRATVVDKVKDAIRRAWPRPAQRSVRTGISEKTKRERVEFKRKRSQLKESRRRIDY